MVFNGRGEDVPRLLADTERLIQKFNKAIEPTSIEEKRLEKESILPYPQEKIPFSIFADASWNPETRECGVG